LFGLYESGKSESNLIPTTVQVRLYIESEANKEIDDFVSLDKNQQFMMFFFHAKAKKKL
jgi:hypothetical protein